MLLMTIASQTVDTGGADLPLWFALFMGLIQGLTEFLPVSSSGHLVIFAHFFGVGADFNEDAHMLFTVLLHIATLTSVIIYFWRDVKAMAVDVFSAMTRRPAGSRRTAARPGENPPAPRRLFIMLIIATLPLFIFVFFSDVVSSLSGKPLFVGVALCCTGALLLLSDRVPRGRKDEKNVTVLDVLCIGMMQGIATVPGLSRSGLTISTGLFRGLNRKFAVRFSFLMSIPAVLGATVLELGKALSVDTDWSVLPVYLAGMLVAGVVGYLSLCLLRRVAEKGFAAFAAYCLVIGSVTILTSLMLGK